MGHTLRLERPRIGIGDDSTTENQQVAQVAIAQFLHHPREQGEVCAAEQREADGVDILLQGGLGDLLRGLVEACVDDLEAVVAQGSGDGLRAAIMAVKTWLCHHNSIGPIHKYRTLRLICRSAQFATLRAESRNVWLCCAGRAHWWAMQRPQLRSNFARAVVPVLLGIGFIILVGLMLWGVAALTANNSQDATANLAPAFQEMGRAEWVASQIDDGGPIILQDLIGSDRNIVLDHTAADGIQIYLAHPADRDSSCQIEQVKQTRQFTDCEGRTLEPPDLALPPKGVRPILNGDGSLTLDLTADVVTPTTTPGTTTG